MTLKHSPTRPLNAGIVDLDRAAHNAQGNDELSDRPPDLEAARSRSPQWVPRIRRRAGDTGGDGKARSEAIRAGRHVTMPGLNAAPDDGHPQHAGNGVLMRHGFTLVWERLARRSSQFSD